MLASLHKPFFATPFRMVALAVVINAVFVWAAWALTPKQQYYQAENAYAALKKNPRHQKYRDKWLACIEKFQRVYRLDPSGPWAAAGLYRSGRLYLELHDKSYLAADRQEAVDAFRRVIQRFPKSSYTPKSKRQLALLGKTAAPPKRVASTGQIEKARRACDQLMDSPAKQKYRDQWETCIDRFQAVYQSEPRGPHAAESLYMIGSLYQGLSVKSRRKSDHEGRWNTSGG
jgi:N-acetylmuramoyl-L-alanine amidase